MFNKLEFDVQICCIYQHKAACLEVTSELEVRHALLHLTMTCDQIYHSLVKSSHSNKSPRESKKKLPRQNLLIFKLATWIRHTDQHCLRSALYITTLFCLWNAYEISLMWFCSQNFANVTVCSKKCYQFTLLHKKTNLRNQTNIMQKNTSPLSCAREVQL